MDDVRKLALARASSVRDNRHNRVSGIPGATDKLNRTPGIGASTIIVVRDICVNKGHVSPSFRSASLHLAAIGDR